MYVIDRYLILGLISYFIYLSHRVVQTLPVSRIISDQRQVNILLHQSLFYKHLPADIVVFLCLENAISIHVKII